MNRLHPLCILVWMLIATAGTAAEYKDSQLFPFGAKSESRKEVQQAGWFPTPNVTNPLKPVSNSIGRSWNSATRVGGKAMDGTRKALTPPKSMLPKIPDLNLPSLPRPKVRWPRWRSEPEPPKVESVGDWLKLPHALPE